MAIQGMVETEGLRPFAKRTGIPLGQIRSLLEGRAVRSTTLERVTSVLGVTLKIGPAQQGDAGLLSSLPPEARRTRDAWVNATLADTIGVLDLERAAIVLELREGAIAVKDLADRVATGAASLLQLIGAWDPAPGPIVRIPFVSDGGSGSGAERPVPDASAPADIRVRAGALALWAHPDALRCVRTTDDAMGGAIQAGGIVAFDPQRTAPLDGELFVLETATGVTVRRLRWRDRWIATSDRADDASGPLSGTDRILGQVAWLDPTGPAPEDK